MSSNAPTDKLYDLQIIEQMCRGNQDQVKNMVVLFTSEVSKTVQEINQAFLEKDFPKIKNLTHKVKPTLAYFGTKDLEREVIFIEKMVQNEFDVAVLETKVTSIQILSSKVVDQIKKDFSF